jgi:hypothetical protein
MTVAALVVTSTLDELQKQLLKREEQLSLLEEGVISEGSVPIDEGGRGRGRGEGGGGCLRGGWHRMGPGHGWHTKVVREAQDPGASPRPTSGLTSNCRRRRSCSRSETGTWMC